MTSDPVRRSPRVLAALAFATCLPAFVEGLFRDDIDLDELAALLGLFTLLPQICRDRWLFRVLSVIVGILVAFLSMGFTFSGGLLMLPAGIFLLLAGRQASEKDRRVPAVLGGVLAALVCWFWLVPVFNG
ncbi:hypothetical protein ACIA8O_13570 [Kitasatospora sp. NPDC051853]|uniref:hypothetical protein n=1 Tax=Kitasatospora sp. NPDC051853 TaxID=3364058 RepID=UPI0037A6798F